MERPDVALIVSCYAVQLIGQKRERNMVRFVEATQNLKEGASEARMPGWVCGKRGSEVRTLKVAGRRSKR